MRILFANEFEATVGDCEFSITFRLVGNKVVDAAQEGTCLQIPSLRLERARKMARGAILDKRKRLVKKALEKLEREKQHTFDF